ncbi:hypothetical protein BS333_21005 (plasmid) [Vibrio azureus]|uniref:Uncharacterized protein n=1 Tax=Vibrio azureus NBRC 104587 TaxID=1219077 RepID=U3APP2_9VIBR|nr:hypothetical protein [Vibrio azureus]AUI88855.1 hypothetical protein BS333_21005 [Vibrio azureus]GAD75252.1 hypothetical protein VAZ01S_023_00190 [Vibrio azureus NBRC 104587]
MEQLLIPLEVQSQTEFYGVWTESEIVMMQEGMLIQALNEINDGRKSSTMRKEAIEWLMNESDEPFSADICALKCGYDINTLRAYLRPIVRKYYS